MWQDAFNSIINGDFLLGLFQVVLATLTSIVNVILYPFGLLIQLWLPALDEGLTALAGYFDYATTYMNWLIDAFAIPAPVLIMVSAYYFFSFTTSFSVWGIKLLLHWKKAIFT